MQYSVGKDEAKYRPWFVSTAFAFVMALIAGQSVYAATANDPVEMARKIAKELRLQTNLPNGNDFIFTPQKTNIEPVRPSSGGGWFFEGWAVSGALRFLVFAALAICIILALWTIRDRLPGLRRRRLAVKEEAVEVVRDASVERMVESQLEAEDLAKQGRIAEAMHILLLRSLIEVRKRLGVSFADSLTSREVLKILSLPEGGNNALADIIRRVEFVYFGDHEARHQDYAACLESYEELQLAMQARRGA